MLKALNLALLSLYATVLLYTPAMAQSTEQVLTATFKEIKESDFGSYGIFTIQNTGERDIDDLVVNLYLKNSGGETLSSTVVTDATPGLVWVKAGASWDEGVPLDRRPGARELLEETPVDGELVLEIKSISFVE